MKSKFGFLKSVAVTGFLASAFILQASAQSIVNVSSINPYIVPKAGYMMGTVNLNNSQVTTPNTNVVPTVVPTATTSNNVCVPYLTSFHKLGDKGVEVAKLQAFLNEYNGAKLNTKGVYGPVTAREVKNLQYAYGIKTTGAQYQKTTDLINKLNCGSIAAKEGRTIYSPMYKGITKSAGKVQVWTKGMNNLDLDNIYPNVPAQVQNTEPTGVINSLPGKNVPPTKIKSPAQDILATSSDMTGGFQSDFDRIKENYKAYVLVFVLVLALFWFLRKAATE
jgi:peptidoglycan hydrolase-like protein with peptidoglycan-binding domain